MDNSRANSCDDLDRAIHRLRLLGAHNDLILLRACCCALKILHAFRCSHCAGHDRLDQFYKFIRKRPCLIGNADITDTKWIHPVRTGGMGIRRFASLASSAFLASVVCTHDIPSDILRLALLSSDPAVNSAMAR